MSKRQMAISLKAVILVSLLTGGDGVLLDPTWGMPSALGRALRGPHWWRGQLVVGWTGMIDETRTMQSTSYDPPREAEGVRPRLIRFATDAPTRRQAMAGSLPSSVGHRHQPQHLLPGCLLGTPGCGAGAEDAGHVEACAGRQ